MNVQNVIPKAREVKAGLSETREYLNNTGLEDFFLTMFFENSPKSKKYDYDKSYAYRQGTKVELIFTNPNTGKDRVIKTYKLPEGGEEKFFIDEDGYLCEDGLETEKVLYKVSVDASKKAGLERYKKMRKKQIESKKVKAVDYENIVSVQKLRDILSNNKQYAKESGQSEYDYNITDFQENPESWNGVFSDGKSYDELSEEESKVRSDNFTKALKDYAGTPLLASKKVKALSNHRQLETYFENLFLSSDDGSKYERKDIQADRQQGGMQIYSIDADGNYQESLKEYDLPASKDGKYRYYTNDNNDLCDSYSKTEDIVYDGSAIKAKKVKAEVSTVKTWEFNGDAVSDYFENDADALEKLSTMDSPVLTIELWNSGEFTYILAEKSENSSNFSSVGDDKEGVKKFLSSQDIDLSEYEDETVEASAKVKALRATAELIKSLSIDNNIEDKFMKKKTNAMTEAYEVIVGNIGTVYSGDDMAEAKSTYESYVADSKADYGRAGGEDVTLMVDGEPDSDYEYFGTQSLNENLNAAKKDKDDKKKDKDKDEKKDEKKKDEDLSEDDKMKKLREKKKEARKVRFEALKKVRAQPATDGNGTPIVGDAPDVDDAVIEDPAATKTTVVEETKIESDPGKVEVEITDPNGAAVVVKLNEELERLSEEADANDTAQKIITDVLEEAGVTMVAINKIKACFVKKTKVKASDFKKVLQVAANMESLIDGEMEDSKKKMCEAERKEMTEIQGTFQAKLEKIGDTMVSIRTGKELDPKASLSKTIASLTDMSKEYKYFKRLVAERDDVSDALYMVANHVEKKIIKATREEISGKFDEYMSMGKIKRKITAGIYAEHGLAITASLGAVVTDTDRKSPSDNLADTMSDAIKDETRER